MTVRKVAHEHAVYDLYGFVFFNEQAFNMKFNYTNTASEIANRKFKR